MMATHWLTNPDSPHKTLMDFNQAYPGFKERLSTFESLNPMKKGSKKNKSSKKTTKKKKQRDQGEGKRKKHTDTTSYEPQQSLLSPLKPANSGVHFMRKRRNRAILASLILVTLAAVITFVMMSGGCEPGLTPSLADSSDCEDIDECMNDPCVHGTCLNTWASYECECDSEWDGKNCDVDANECVAQTFDCTFHQLCVDKQPGYACLPCLPGEARSVNGRSCEADVDTCTDHEPCQHEGTCVDTGATTYLCECTDFWHGDNCEIDVDECAEGGGGCTAPETCVNVDGKHFCDRDECIHTSGQVRCESNERCQNTPEAFECIPCKINEEVSADGLSCLIVADYCSPLGIVVSESEVRPEEGVLVTGSEFGWSLAGLGDLDGNGVPDFISRCDDGAENVKLRVVFREADGSEMATSHFIAEGEGGFGSGSQGDINSFGYSVATTDIDLDGTMDVVVGDPRRYDGNLKHVGAVWVLLLSSSRPGDVKHYQRISPGHGGFSPTGTLPENYFFGSSVAGAGHMKNGNSVVVVGSPSQKTIHIMHLDSKGMVVTGSWSGATKVREVEGFGRSIAGLGEGLWMQHVTPQLVVGADKTNGNKGAVYILTFNSITISKYKIGAEELEEKLTATSQFGTAVATLGDVNGDSFPDIAVGCADNTVFVITLGSTGLLIGFQEISQGVGGFTGSFKHGDKFGHGLASLGVDDSGILQLAVGAPGDNNNGDDAGVVYVIGVPPAIVDPCPEKTCNNIPGAGSVCV